VSGRRVLATLGLILLATAVVPPLGAFAVNRARVRSAEAAVRTVAQALRDDEPRLAELARGADVLCGPGRMPLAQAPKAQGWVTAPRAGWGAPTRARLAPPADPWGNCYVVSLAAVKAPGMAVWALSAGPDGIIDTPFLDASDLPAGDDVGIRVR
jgi:type II secretory pathway pseudopilin PulG